MLLSVSELTRTLGSKKLFSRVSFDLAEGETLAVLGPSGSGKSSLIRCLAGLDEASAGEVLLEGGSLKDLGASVWRSSLCYVAQRPPLLRGSARAFLEQVQSLQVQNGRDVASPFELAERWGLAGEKWDQEFSKLSGGEQQRALLAVAISRKPRVLLLDEPTSALDDETARKVEGDLAVVSAVWVTHDVAQAKRVAQKTLDLET
jgi:putative ABC transport system ATP-binding protein